MTSDEGAGDRSDICGDIEDWYVTIAKLQLIRRLLLQLVAMIDAELRDRGERPAVSAREYHRQ